MTKQCPGCRASSDFFLRDGTYFRSGDSRHIQRFRCRNCAKRFSAACFSDAYNQKNRRCNPWIRKLLANGLSQRGIAEVLGISKNTVARRVPFLAGRARHAHQRFLTSYIRKNGPIECMQFDDQFSFEHTKCKPLCISVAVCSKTRLVLGYAVSVVPANGLLAAVSRKKYGKRRDESRAARDDLFARLTGTVSAKALIQTDKHKHYPVIVKRHFPKATHRSYKGAKASVTGQGEMKKLRFDRLFSINHTLATFRDRVKRLSRRTWCTTKKAERLDDILAILVDYHRVVKLKLEP